MTPEQIQQLSLAFETFNDPHLLQTYLNDFLERAPGLAEEVHQAQSCFDRSHNANQCLNAIYNSSDPVVPPLSRQVRAYGSQVVREARTMLAQSSNLRDFARRIEGIFYERDFRDLPLGERLALAGLVDYFAPQFISSVQAFDRRLRQNSEWRQNLETYRNESLPPITGAGLSDNLCVNNPRLISAENPLPYFPNSYLINRSPDDRIFPSSFTNSDLQIFFEVLEIFLPPQVLWELIQTRQISTFGSTTSGTNIQHNYFSGIQFYLFGPNETHASSRPWFQTCTPDLDPFNLAGAYSNSGEIYLSLLSEGNSPDSCQPTAPRIPLAPYLILGRSNFDNFLHEMAHAMQHRLLSRSDNEKIRAFYTGSRAQLDLHPSHVDLIPNYSSRNHDSTSIDFREYGLTDEKEFFAEMVVEYIRYEMFDDPPDSPLYRARRRIMQAFFGRNGIQAEAFQQVNIEQAFRAEQVDLDTLYDFSPLSSQERCSEGRYLEPAMATRLTPQFRTFYRWNSIEGSAVGVSAGLGSRSRLTTVNWGVSLSGLQYFNGSNRIEAQLQLGTPYMPFRHPFFGVNLLTNISIPVPFDAPVGIGAGLEAVFRPAPRSVPGLHFFANGLLTFFLPGNANGSVQAGVEWTFH